MDVPKELILGKNHKNSKIICEKTYLSKKKEVKKMKKLEKQIKYHKTNKKIMQYITDNKTTFYHGGCTNCSSH